MENLLIVSPPQCGKTTLIRDLARLASTGTVNTPAFKVGIIDERSEIAGCLHGVPQHDIGPRTDVLDACPKAEGMMMMIRSMSPEILIVDEIGREEDSRAIFEAIFAGVHIFTTAHGYSLDDLCQRPTLSKLMKEKVFTRIFLLSRRYRPWDGRSHLRSVVSTFGCSGGERSMIKIFGACLVLIATSWMGFEIARSYRERPKEIRQLRSALSILETEIGYGVRPLTVACQEVSLRTRGAISKLFASCAENLNRWMGHRLMNVFRKRLIRSGSIRR